MELWSPPSSEAILKVWAKDDVGWSRTVWRKGVVHLGNLKEAKQARWDVGGEGEDRVTEGSLTFLAWAVGKGAATEGVQCCWIWGRGEEGRCAVKF